MRATMLRVAAAVAAVLALALPGTAAAEPPLRLPEQITDRSGVLGADQAAVQDALDRLREEDQVQLFVVYVESFDGQGPQTWADETARLSGFGLQDALLAIATEDRAYAYSVDQNFPLSDEDLQDIALNDIEPRLSNNDWAGAAVAAADGYRAAIGGARFSPSWIVGGTAVLGVGGYLVYRATRRSRQTASGAAAEASTAAPDPLQSLPTEELAKQASALLIETDDAVRTSEQDLGFAEAEFGAEAVVPFRQTLDQARAHLAESFEVRQRLDDSLPEDEGDTANADRFDNLAKLALQRQMQYESEVNTAQPPIDAQRQVVEKLKTGLQGMKQKLSELQSKRSELLARAKVAHAQATVQEAVKSIDVMDPTSELGRFEEKIRREEARVAGQAELAASSIDAQFESLEDLGEQAEIEARLAELKAGASPAALGTRIGGVLDADSSTTVGASTPGTTSGAGQRSEVDVEYATEPIGGDSAEMR